MTGPLVLAVNCVYHESSACLFDGTRLVAFVEEERFSRRRRAKTPELHTADVLPKAAIRHCLNVGGVDWLDLDIIATSYNPNLRTVDVDEGGVVLGGWGSAEGEAAFLRSVARIPDALSALAGFDVTDMVRWVAHHQAHAASAYFASPYEDAAVLSIDGIGEKTTTLLGYGTGIKLEILREIVYPASIGLLWEEVATFLGMNRYAGPGKLLGLAAFGSSQRFRGQLEKVVLIGDGDFSVDNHYAGFRAADNRFAELFGPAYPAGAEMDSRAADVAAALQAITEDVLESLTSWLLDRTGSGNLCLAGGVALNCVANGRICRSGRVRGMYVQPAANDAGTALGAALHVLHSELGHTTRFTMSHPYWGPRHSEAELIAALTAADLEFSRCADVCEVAARLLADGKVLGWFQGFAEVGPRALGNRSILADPRRTGLKDAINLHVKHREYWRPFSPSILADAAPEWLERGVDSQSHGFMSFSYPVHEEKRSLIPGAVHFDGTARAQLVTEDLNPLYHRLISAFAELTGVPVLLNTSFNGPDEPMVSSPEDAVHRFRSSGLDALVLGDFLVTGRVALGGDS